MIKHYNVNELTNLDSVYKFYMEYLNKSVILPNSSTHSTHISSHDICIDILNNTKYFNKGGTSNVTYKDIQGDGNCLYYSLSWIMHGHTDMYNTIRQQIVDHVCDSKDYYMDFFIAPRERINGNHNAILTFDSWCNKMRNDRCYGDNISIQGFCNIYNYNIIIFYLESKTINFIRCESGNLINYGVLIYINNNHYDTVNPYNLQPTRALIDKFSGNEAIPFNILD